MRFKFVFYSKGVNIIQIIKITVMFRSYFYNANNFLQQDNDIVVVLWR